MSLSPATQSILGDVLVTAATAVGQGLRAQDDAAALRVARLALLASVAVIESAEAREKFPDLRED